MADPPKTVVVVEDEWLLRRAAVEELANHGFRVFEASNSAEALEILGEHNPRTHVLFTDVHMPGKMNGLELAHYAHKHWPWINALIASGHARIAQHELPSRGRFVSKPYEIDDVITHVRQLADEQ